MGICKDSNTKFCHFYIFQSRQKRKEYSGLTTEYDVARGVLKSQCKIWEFRATSYSVKPLYYLYPITNISGNALTVLDYRIRALE